MDRLSCDLEFKFDDQTGKIDGYGSVFNLIDRGGDIVLPGAFKASLRAKGSAGVPMLWNHDASAPIGVWTDYAEDEKGLKLSGQLVLEVPQAAAVRALIKAKAIRGLSIGYQTQDYTIDRATGARSLKKVNLWEVSVVTFPMLPEAQITGVKGAFDPRELERVLRSECNLSSAEAVKAVAIVKKHLRDGGDPLEQAARDGTKDLLMSLRKASTALS